MATRAEMITLIVPFGQKRQFKLHLQPEIAGWLRDQLTDALGEPRQRPRRPVRLRRGRWTTQHQVNRR